MTNTKSDIYHATAELLCSKYEISTQLINELLSDFHLKYAIDILGEHTDRIEKMAFLLRAKEQECFSASRHDSVVKLRKKIIQKWDEDKINSAFDKYCHSSGKTLSHKARKLSEMRWSCGKAWAHMFMEYSGIDNYFAGKRINNEKKSQFEDILPFIKLPELVEYQIKLKEALIKVIKEKGNEAKCLLSLPTGGGKTRVAVEAYIEYLRPRFAEGKYLIWIAQSEELCEQAIKTFQDMWKNKEFTECLRIYRLFGSHNMDVDSMIGGVVVCSINKLYNVINESQEGDACHNMIQNCSTCIIDEAHRAVTKMYNKFYDYSQTVRGEQMFPICGLTATPGRNNDTLSLTSHFLYRLFTPEVPSQFKENPILYFRKEKYLALPYHVEIATGQAFVFSDEDGEKIETEWKKLKVGEKTSPELQELMQELIGDGCKKLADNVKRNKIILDTLLSLPDNAKVLVYACTVAHAELINSLLIAKGRKSAVITGNTPRYKRHAYIDKFKSDELQFIINHSVLTTGFDAPKTDHIVLCRPTFSDILYEQIVGRGLRGPRFGGTETCKIIDFCDTCERFGDQQSYKRFETFWFQTSD